MAGPAAPAGLWFIAFPSDASLSRVPWWARPLARGYRHCLACQAAGEAHTLVVDHRGSHLVVAVEPVPIGIFLRGLQEAAAAWIIAVEAVGGAHRGRLRPPMTCTEVCKALLGLRAWWIITPAQLARHLRQIGGKPVLPSSPQHKETRPWPAL